MDKIKQANNKALFIELLKSTEREGIDQVIMQLENLGFFTAPASTKFHLNHKGGLLEHSLNVYRMAKMIVDNIAEDVPVDSLIIASLLHDVCKAEIYVKTIKKRKGQFGLWEEYEGYDVDYSDFPCGHGEKSVIRLLQFGLSMTEDEILAIRWHMGPWDLPFQSPESKNNLNIAKQ